MLRRIAEHLFWAARYLERAQWRARLVDVNYNLLLEVPPRAADPWEPILAITGERDAFSAAHSHADERPVLTFFTLDSGNPSSIRSCIAAARANLRAMRHQIPTEFWLEVNRLYIETATWPDDIIGLPSVPGFYSGLRERFYAIGGVVSATMPRALPFDFFEAGTALECADNVARLLDVKYHYLLPGLGDVGASADLRQWAAVLRSASSLEAFWQIHGNDVQAGPVVELLIFDRRAPRSARFCIDRLRTALDHIAEECGGPSAQSLGVTKLHESLASASATEVIASGLHEFLVGFQQDCARISSRIAESYMTVD